MENRSQNQSQQQLQLQELSLRNPPQPCISLLPHQQHHLEILGRNHNQEMEQMTDFQNHQLPPMRVKKVMKGDHDVNKVSSEAPVIIAKACEMFIHDLTLRAWLNAQENNVRTIEPINIYDAICHTDTYKFLIDITPSSGGSSSEIRRQSHYPYARETYGHVGVVVDMQDKESLETLQLQSLAHGMNSNRLNYS